MIDHDGKFKQLFSKYFLEFIDVFFPDLAEYLERDSIALLDKELYESQEDMRSHADLVFRAKVRNKESFFIVHIEPQEGKRNLTKFGKRMLKYFVGIHEKYDLPVYPIVVFTFGGRSRQQQPSIYEVKVAELEVLRFEYRVVQLNRLDYRRFLPLKNPVATALISKMPIEKSEKRDVLLECVRINNSLDLPDEERAFLNNFVRDYSGMSQQDVRQLLRKASQLDSPEREEIMKSLDPWTEYGRIEGRLEECSRVVLRLLARRFGTLDDSIITRISSLSLPLLEQLAEDMLDFKTISELDDWMSCNESKAKSKKHVSENVRSERAADEKTEN